MAGGIGSVLPSYYPGVQNGIQPAVSEATFQPEHRGHADDRQCNRMRNLKTLLMLATFALTAFAQQNTRAPANSLAAPEGAPTPSVATQSTSSAAQQQSSPDPLLDVPPLPNSKVTLVGGVVTGIDRVRNKLSVEAFGGKKMKMFFDERSHIYRDGVETTQLGIRKGDRVYVDTQLDGTRVFARNVRVENTTGSADARGQIISVDAKRGTVLLRDELSSQPVTFHVDSKTTVRGKGASIADLAPGSLVTIHFSPERGDRSLAQQIIIAARPGETVTFSGQITHLDVRDRILAVQNETDGKSYEVRFDPASVGVGELSVGSTVAITATFDGSGYTTRNVNLIQAKK